MDQGDWKLRIFYQNQIAKIAKLAREQTHPTSRKRLNFLLDQYIDMLLIMPRANQATDPLGVTASPSAPVLFGAVSLPEAVKSASGPAVAPADPALVVPAAAVDGGLTEPGRIGGDVVNLTGNRSSHLSNRVSCRRPANRYNDPSG
jgi:hypothetical protein